LPHPSKVLRATLQQPYTLLKLAKSIENHWYNWENFAMEKDMFKRVCPPLLALLVLLSACRGNTPATATLVAATQVPPTQQPGCTVVSVIPTAGPTEPSLFPPVSEADWVIGPETAEVTILEYSDFQ
jgi:hypothetical protein